MTPAEIYNRVAFYLYGGSNVPSEAQAVIQGVGGLIDIAHRQLQRLDNFWFMETYTTYLSEQGVSKYNLPDNFKEIISVLVKTTDGINFTKPLTPLSRTQSQKHYWQALASQATYPLHYEIVDEAIVLYPEFNQDDLEIHLFYHMIIPFDAENETDVMKYAGDILVDMVVADMADSRKEYDDSQVFRQRVADKMELLRREEGSRRESYIKQLNEEL